jgi:hypothetical protein
VSGVFPLVKENIYIPSLGPGSRLPPSYSGCHRDLTWDSRGQNMAGWPLCPHQVCRLLPWALAATRPVHIPHFPWGLLTAPQEIISHSVTRKEERECKCLDGIRGAPQRWFRGHDNSFNRGLGRIARQGNGAEATRKGAGPGYGGELASLATFKRFPLRLSHKMRYCFIYLVPWPFAFLCVNIKLEMAVQQHILESVLRAVICMVGLVSRLLTF